MSGCCHRTRIAECVRLLPHVGALPSDTHTLDKLRELFSMLNIYRRTQPPLVIEGTPFGLRMAQMLVKISLDLRLTKHVSLLPKVSG